MSSSSAPQVPQPTHLPGVLPVPGPNVVLRCDRCAHLNKICIRRGAGLVCASCSKDRKNCNIGETNYKHIDSHGNVHATPQLAKQWDKDNLKSGTDGSKFLNPIS